MSRWFRKAWCLPLSSRKRAASNQITSVFKASLLLPNIRLSDRRAAAYLSLSSSTRSRSPRSQSLQRRQASRFRHRLPLVRSAMNAKRHQGNSDTKKPLSYCYELPTQLRLESVANAHTAADLHVRSWVSYRAGQESLERRERVTNTPSAISDNP